MSYHLTSRHGLAFKDTEPDIISFNTCINACETLGRSKSWAPKMDWERSRFGQIWTRALQVWLPKFVFYLVDIFTLMMDLWGENLDLVVVRVEIGTTPAQPGRVMSGRPLCISSHTSNSRVLRSQHSHITSWKRKNVAVVYLEFFYQGSGWHLKTKCNVVCINVNPGLINP